MNTFDIMGTIRNFTGLETENDLGSVLLKRMTNLGMMYVGQLLMPLYHEFLVKTKDYTGEAGSSIDLPGDVLRILDIYRDDADSLAKLCTAVPVENRGLIDINPNYSSSEAYPLYVHEGRQAVIAPALATTNVSLRYRKRLVDLVEGDFTYASATTGTLGADALPIDDLYNNYDLAVYTVTASAVTLVGTFLISDYVGSTKVVTLTGAALTSVKMKYALVPIIPGEFHNFIVDAGIAQVKRIKLYQDKIEGLTSWQDDLVSLKSAIKETLDVNLGMRREEQ